tara:strand:+ start:676 stop:966 length:291 start_codon:yes stop_codon:yes gene_type:complete
MHTRRQIIKNQKDFLYEIKKSLNKDFSNSKQELSKIETGDKEIIDAKKSLESKFKNVKIEKEINKFLINENNIYPKYYVWWDEYNERVEIFLYEIK